tara:strand:+ start:165 stop:1340 length:1176 start_codon:yes stop_codon:yes gene_type:complete
MSQLKVNTIRHTGASSDAITLASDGTAAIGECTAKVTNLPQGNRRLNINGDMKIAQRNTSTATADGVKTVDRMYVARDGGTCQQQRATLTSSDTGPWEKGFKYSLKLTNTASSSSEAAYREIQYRFEGQDLNSWNHTSTSSYITVSFWAKSSLAGTYYLWLRSKDGTNKVYSHSYTLAANTWKKVSFTTPGASNITIDNDTGNGLNVNIAVDWGTNFTDAGTSTGSWASFVSGTRLPNFAQDWNGTTDATFEVTGLQVEAGDFATDFEHRSYSYEILRCQRYCMKWEGGTNYRFPVGLKTGDTQASFSIFHSVPMRALTGRAVSHTISTTAVQSGPGGNQNPPTISLDEGGSGLLMTFIVITNINTGGSNGDIWQTRVSDSDWYLIVENEL